VAAFSDGLSGYAGRFWLPTDENKAAALATLAKLRARTTDTLERRFIDEMRLALELEELHHPPAAVLNTLVAYAAKEGINERHLRPLVTAFRSLLAMYTDRFGKRRWPIELRVLATNEAAGARQFVLIIKKAVRDGKLKREFGRLAADLAAYREKFGIAKLKKGDFDEVWPILKKTGGQLNRRTIYPRILRIRYDYPESAAEIESKALDWLEADLPKFREIVRKLARVYGCKAQPEAVTKSIARHHRVKKSDVIATTKRLRKLLQPVVESSIVRITPRHKVIVTETPPYLVNVMPTAAMMSFDVLTKRPFNVIYMTVDPRGSPPEDVTAIIDLIMHEEYGHAVNFSNSGTAFAVKARRIEVVGDSFATPITEGLSFHREIEGLELLRTVVEKPPSEQSPAEAALIKELKKYGDPETVAAAYEFGVYKWRLTRFLRAMCDSRVNTGKQSIVQFVEWAHDKTGIARKMIYDQNFFFQENPGYAPCYSMAGMAIRDIQAQALARGVSLLEFNTYLSSMAFPPRTIFEKRLKERFCG